MKNKKYIYIGVFILILFAISTAVYIQQNRFDGSTIESRELILNKSKKGLHISSEIRIKEYIISEITSINGQYGFAVFEPQDKEKYKLQTRVLRNENEIVFGNHIWLGDKYYDVFLFDQNDLDYALATYTINNNELEPLKLDIIQGKIAYTQTPTNDYSLNIVFYDTHGNIYK